MIYLVIALIVIALAVFLWLNNNILVTSKYTAKCAENNGFTAIHLSDLHSKAFGNRLYKKVLELNPDVIFITGDLVDDTRTEKRVYNLVKRLCEKFKVYYICGNHDHRIAKMEENLKSLKSYGVIVLRDEIDCTEICGEKVSVLGLDENQASKEDYKNRKQGKYTYIDNSKFFKELSSCDGIKIVLSHYPENYALIGDLSYKNYDFDVMLSGHAHGGQWRFPFVGGLYAPGQGKFPKYCSGEFGNHPKLIVSRGLGNSKFPFRLFNFPEICIIEFIR